MVGIFKKINQRNFVEKINHIPFSYLLIFIYMIQIIASITPDTKDLQLIFVYQHIRHGARGPSASYNSLFNKGIIIDNLDVQNLFKVVYKKEEIKEPIDMSIWCKSNLLEQKISI